MLALFATRIFKVRSKIFKPIAANCMTAAAVVGEHCWNDAARATGGIFDEASSDTPLADDSATETVQGASALRWDGKVLQFSDVVDNQFTLAGDV
jgi:hypothetical protein